MHASSEIRAAIQELAGFFTHDDLTAASSRCQVNESFSAARGRLEGLLRNQESLTPDETTEMMTMLVILSVNDVSEAYIILVDRRAKKPAVPRWLEGYKLCQQLLNLTTSSAQILDNKLAPAPSPIITSQAIMVGKALILAETLMPLPTPSDFDAQRDVGRFSWLFPGSSCSSRDRPGLEIHGGCGFSTALLHRISQITYCASRLHQYADSAVVPVTAQFLYDDLANMRQWSGESMDWETAQMMPAMMERIRKLPDDYVMHSSAVMMNVTAEAWRIAAIIYLQCRVLRQSVPPLFESLKRIWGWIDADLSEQELWPWEQASPIARRYAWWEDLVARIDRTEDEVLCLA
ncbi:hypothetical protein E4U54_004409 [Claviceps lovelessii]|nr:hypothetical protein E4U54_004409 [Claviceps lovelessii]